MPIYSSHPFWLVTVIGWENRKEYLLRTTMCIFLTYPRPYPFEVGIFTSVLEIRNKVQQQSQGHPLLGNITRFYLRGPEVSDWLGGLTGLGT